MENRYAETGFYNYNILILAPILYLFSKLQHTFTKTFHFSSAVHNLFGSHGSGQRSVIVTSSG